MPSASSENFEQHSFFAEDDPTKQKLLFGSGSVAQLGSVAKSLGTRALLVTDAGLSKVGHAQKVYQLLKSAGLEVFLYDRSIENPTDSSVQACKSFADQSKVDLIVGLGGGSSMDTAKGCNFLLSNGGKMADYWGVGKAKQAMLPLIAIPTTAGTGSECQSFALISDDNTHKKMACGDAKALPAITILDPELTISQPSMVTACTGVDALAHALESAVTSKRNDYSSRHSGLAFELIEKNLPLVLHNPSDKKARAGILLGASHAGAAIERSMLGAAHSMANPLTACKSIVHGIAVGMSLPLVMNFNAADPDVRKIYSSLARRTDLATIEHSDEYAVELLIERVIQLLKLAGFPGSIAELGVDEHDILILAKDASEQWTANFNPRAIECADFEALYSQLFHSAFFKPKFFDGG
jgi:alcohol dehydrogenase